MLKYFTSAVLLGAAAAKNIIPDGNTGFFKDTSHNRTRIMHGLNVVVKLPNYLPTQGDFDWQYSLDDTDLQLMQDWGVKVVRLGVMWEAVETAPGVYDQAYLTTVDTLITKMAKYDIAVIVDNHQDLFSRKLCGEGVPAFYTPTDLETTCPRTILGDLFWLAKNCRSITHMDLPVDDQGLPLTSSCAEQNFEELYTAPEVADAFGALYTNRDGLLDKMLAFWTVVSEKF